LTVVRGTERHDLSARFKSSGREEARQ
jgi:hypothetical protein